MEELKAGEMMQSKITPSQDVCESSDYPIALYPVVLEVKMGSEKDMEFSFLYRLQLQRGERGAHVSGIVESHGMSSVNPLDDADADDYWVDAERESVKAVASHLRQQFPEFRITGWVQSRLVTAYHQEHGYEI